jgi:outer membrane protein, multidrug efflux system
MKPLHAAWLLSATSAALILTGCATPPEIDIAQLPSPPLAFKEARGDAGAGTPLPASGAWWKTFDDPVLDQLVQRALERNDRIHVAAARLDAARALVRAADARRAPQIGVGASAFRGTQPQTGSVPLTRLGAGVNLSYEVDVLGKLSRVTDVARLDSEEREALLRSARLMVQAEVAQAYFSLRALDMEAEIVRGTVIAYAGTLRLTESRLRAGEVSELDVARVRTEVATTEAEAVALERRRAQLEHAVAVLVGEPASEFNVAARPWNATLPIIPAGVPATVLTRRPDVTAAQRQLLAAQARVGVAQSAWFPDLQLTAAGGFASPDLSDLFKWSARSWGLGALLALPLFDGGKRDAGVRAAQAEMDAAFASYREQVLVAFRDVEDQLSALRLLSEEARVQDVAVSSAGRATALSAARYRNGVIGQLEFLDAQRSELRSRREGVQVRAAQYQTTVALVRALGGSWDDCPFCQR